ncbi:xanthine/uracil/vitamin C permease [Psychromonas sp. CNPT3]|uniref:NCS2 family permease n=1 Tax=Psychromonas sp. CNPT3 TaxID=314282 RepID=UPI00006E913D|nr:NCS2 family permease [Psychromonas sp. CNPT3]AGH81857.1 xanthine/uracil/vitamin C permease [Psychromonas sp. CNPT3]
MLEKIFKLNEHKTTIKTELIAGATTFLTMAYIIFVNPAMLSPTGMDPGAVFVATCLAAAIGCFIMGFYANYPVALAPGMGLSAFFTYVVVLDMGYSWQVSLGAVFLSGVCFTTLSLFKIREWIINSIPMPMRHGIAAGIGLFLALIALENSGIVISNSATLVTLGDMTALPAALASLSFFLIIALAHFRVKGGVMIAILVVTFIGFIIGDVEYAGIVSMPPSIMPTFMQMDIAGAFNVGMISIIFAFLFVDLFDTSGTLLAVASRANLLDENGNLPRLNRALLADSGASIAGAMLGTSTTTSYIESVAGVAEGGRTGLTAVVVGVLFLCSLFFAPLAGMIPSYATAGALLYVAVLMIGSLKDINWDDITEAAPVVVVTIMMPLTYSIANGIALGFISYAAIKIFSGRYKELSSSVWFLAILFLVKLIYFP